MLRHSAQFATVALLLTAHPGNAAAATAARVVGAGARAATAASPKRAEPLDVTRDFYKALHAGNASAAAKLSATKGAEPALRAFVELSRAYRNLETALAKRFGPEAAAEVGYGRRVQAEIKSLLGASVEVDGDVARVSAMDGHTISTLRNVKGDWRVELEDALASPEGRAVIAQQATAAKAASKQVVAGVRRGKYETPRAAMQDFEQRVSGAMGESKEAKPDEEGPALPDEGGAQL